MAEKSMITGGVLILLGVVVTILSDSGSVTSLIPAFIGIVFVALGAAARLRPALNHHLMHGAAALALIAILASLGSLIGRGSTGWALFSQLATVAVTGVFIYLAVLSFRAARKAREAAAA